MINIDFDKRLELIFGLQYCVARKYNTKFDWIHENYKKYNDEFKSIYKFLISLNIYMLFLLYIKYHYDIKIRHSFKVVFSKISSGAFCVFMTLFHCLYLFWFYIV